MRSRYRLIDTVHRISRAALDSHYTQRTSKPNPRKQGA